jgi:putative transposase
VTDYRRYFVPGGSYFFTVALADRSLPLLTENITGLRTAFRHVRTEMPFTIDAIVVLPDHLHTIWVLPPGDSDFSTRWKKIKAVFSRHLPDFEYRSVSRTQKGERGIWQRRFWEHALRDESDWRRHMDYIHFNPVKHGHVRCVADWVYSSFHRYVQLGAYPRDWGDVHEDDTGAYGE